MAETNSSYPDGIPNPDKFGFIQVNALDHGAEFDDSITALCQVLGREPIFIDDRGYENEITAASLDAERQRYAWVECESNEASVSGHVSVSFILYVRANDIPVVQWNIETYNPYFGCQVEQMIWMADHFVLIYHEKHHTYACCFSLQPPAAPQKVEQNPKSSGVSSLEALIRSSEHAKDLQNLLARHQIADEWLIHESTLVYRSETVDRVERRSLPDLQLLESWSASYARSIRALPPGYDDTNEAVRKYQV